MGLGLDYEGRDRDVERSEDGGTRDVVPDSAFTETTMQTHRWYVPPGPDAGLPPDIPDRRISRVAKTRTRWRRLQHPKLYHINHNSKFRAVALQYCNTVFMFQYNLLSLFSEKTTNFYFFNTTAYDSYINKKKLFMA
jgi:hypothetical protein